MSKNDSTLKRKYGLIGRNISYSFSKKYFADKFEKENITDSFYDVFDLEESSKVKEVFETPNLKGLNVTIPYKQDMIPYMDKLSEDVQAIGALNTIKITPEGKKIGHNTDFYGFSESLKPFLKSHHTKALVLGTGGAAKAVVYALEKLGIDWKYVSRTSGENKFSYEDLSQEILNDYTVLVNCTPLGTFPDIEKCPAIPYEFITDKHLAYDLVYNPEKTTFLKKAEQKGATIKNGHEMLVLQAEKSYQIWEA